MVWEGLLVGAGWLVSGEVGVVPTVVGALVLELTDVSGELALVPGELGVVSEELGSLATDVGTLATELGSLALDVGSLALDVGSLVLDVGSLAPEVGLPAELDSDTRGPGTLDDEAGADDDAGALGVELAGQIGA